MNRASPSSKEGNLNSVVRPLVSLDVDSDGESEANFGGNTFGVGFG